MKRCNVFLYNTYDAFYLRKTALRNTLRNKSPVIDCVTVIMVLRGYPDVPVIIV